MDEIISIDSIADEISINYGYLYLLNREPETKADIGNALSVQRTIKQLRRDIIDSDEYRSLSKLMAAEPVWRNIISKYPSLIYEQLDSNDVLVLSTCDPLRYFDMFVTTSRFNRLFCMNNGLIYQSFIGIKRGYYPHHAMLNRVHMLKELIDSGHRDWVLYHDADCIIMDPSWEIKQQLLDLRRRSKVILVNNVRNKDDPLFHWWDINDGSFAIDLSANLSRCLINCWSFFYTSIYSLEDYKKATHWDSVVNDQNSLHYILRIMEEYVDIRSHIESVHFHNYIKNGEEFAYPVSPFHKVLQALRSDATNVSTDEELKIRELNLTNHGKRIWSMQTDL